MAYDLSIIIPARNEEFLADTIENILENIEMDTEVVAVLDGEWSEPAIDQHPRVNVIYVNQSIGQRAATNLGVKISKGKYIMKVDAHCMFDKGFDRKMFEGFEIAGKNTVMLPVMRNLHIFDWVCPEDGERLYQDKIPKCPKCGADMRREMKWIPKTNPQSASYCFSPVPQFMYFGDYTKRDEYKKDKERDMLTQTMSIQGSCFMCARKMYDKLNLCDEKFGSWGNQGIEVACKTWLSGGKVLANHRTWYAHLFRTKSNFMFPWPVSGNEQAKTKKRVRDAVYGGKLPHQKYPVSWLVEKFWPVKEWTDEDLAKLKEEEHAPGK